MQPLLPEIAQLKRLYELEPHPEGGFYRQTYRSDGVIASGALPPEFGGDRRFGTAILYLLGPGDKSALHRIRQDEVWHFYQGGPLRLVMLSPAGDFSEVVLGPDIMAGQKVQFVVPKGFWFGAKPLPGASYAFVGCTVCPGFEFADFELGDKNALLRQFPAHAHLIQEFAK